MRVSILIPTLDEERELGAALESALAQDAALVSEVLVVDGGSRDATRSLVRPPARLLGAPRGRARQLNAGLRAATGEAVLVLHADCVLPPGALAAVVRALADPDVAGGAFHKRFRSRHALLRLPRARTRAWHALFGAVFGDQAQFARRDLLVRLGGFREDVVAEDLDLAWRLRAHGRVVLLPAEVSASARRLERRGVLRTWASWWTLATRQALGMRPPEGRGGYPDVRVSWEREEDRGSSGS